MRLIYINEIGIDYKGNSQYEFIFSEETEFEMESWYIIPSSSSTESTVPDLSYINCVGLLKDTEMKLELVQNSDYFGIIDAVENIIALGWEKFDIDATDRRLSFKFGETMESVDKKLKQKNYILKKEYTNE